MSYYEDLLDSRWYAFRHWIIERDNYRCKSDGCKFVSNAQVFQIDRICRGDQNFQLSNLTILIDESNLGLSVHHNYYIEGKRPWEYEPSAVITVCPTCHKKIHDTTKIQIYTNSGLVNTTPVTCNRCGGSGYLPQYSHIENGICFKCWGAGKIFLELLKRLY
jgi:RNase P subunit RPR2